MTGCATSVDSVRLPIAASGSGTFNYSATGLPSDLSINAGTGLITGTLSATAAAIGNFPAMVTVSDGTHSVSVGFAWSVAAAGTITMTNPGSPSSAEGAAVSLNIGAGYTGGGALRYFAQGLPAGLAINPATGVISGTVALGAASAGPYAVTVFATDGTTSSQVSFTWMVSGTITLAAIADQTSTEGQAVSLSPSVTYSGGGTLSYGAVGLPPGLAINPSTGAITGAVALGDAANGPYTVTVSVGDGTSGASQTFTWNVNSPVTITTPADQTSTEGDSISPMTITASDSSGGTLIYAAAGLPPGLSIDPGAGIITGTIPVGAAGTYTVEVTAGDGMYSASTTFSWIVSSPILIKDPGEQDFHVGDSVNLPIQATDSRGGTLSYRPLNLPSGLSINSATGVIFGTISNTVENVGYMVSRVLVSDGTYVATGVVTWLIAAPSLGLATSLQEKAPPKGTAKPVQYIRWTIADQYKWLEDRKEVNTSKWIKYVKDTYEVDLTNRETLKRFIDNRASSLHFVRQDPKNPNIYLADFFSLTRYQVDLNGADASIVQDVKVELKLTPVEGAPITQKQRIVEGWVVMDGKAAGFDYHGTRLKPLPLNTRMFKSLTFTASFEAGAGLINGKKVDGKSGEKDGSVPGIYDFYGPTVPDNDKKITWSGVQANNLKYTVKFTLNADGTWTWDDPSADLRKSGTAGKVKE